MANGEVTSLLRSFAHHKRPVTATATLTTTQTRCVSRQKRLRFLAVAAGTSTMGK